MTPLLRDQPASHSDLAALPFSLDPGDLPPSDDSRSNGHRKHHLFAGGQGEATLAGIFHRYGPAYRAAYEARMLPSHRRAMAESRDNSSSNIPAACKSGVSKPSVNQL